MRSGLRSYQTERWFNTYEYGDDSQEPNVFRIKDKSNKRSHKANTDQGTNTNILPYDNIPAGIPGIAKK